MKANIVCVRFREGASLGNGAEVQHALHPASFVSGSPVTISFDSDERFIRIESKNCVDLVPLSNVASMKVVFEEEKKK